MRFNKDKYFQSTDLSLVGLLQQGDVIIHTRKFYNTWDKTEFNRHVAYIVQYKPVFFERAGNWSVRITTKSDNGSPVYNETVHINTKVIYRYYFPKTILNRSTKLVDEQLQSLFEELDEQIILDPQ